MNTAQISFTTKGGRDIDIQYLIIYSQKNHITSQVSASVYLNGNYITDMTELSENTWAIPGLDSMSSICGPIEDLIDIFVDQLEENDQTLRNWLEGYCNIYLRSQRYELCR